MRVNLSLVFTLSHTEGEGGDEERSEVELLSDGQTQAVSVCLLAKLSTFLFQM